MDLDCEAFDRRSMPKSSYDAGAATSANFDNFNQTRDKLIEEGWYMSFYYDAGVATTVDVNVDEFNQVRDKFIEEGWTMSSYVYVEDASSLSSYEYHSPEEAYYSSGEDGYDDYEDVSVDKFDQIRDELIKEGWNMSAFYDTGVATSVNDDKYCFPVTREESFDWSIPASSYDCSVATSADVNVDKCSPVTREESYKQERDEDASSMSSVDYHYSEEDYWCSGEDDDDEEEDEEDNEEPISKLERKDFVDSCRARDQKRPPVPLEVWVDSWKGENHPKPFAWVNVYAYYNSKHKSYGGYGVILRDWLGKPITASAKFSADGKSFFTQVLMGIKAGLTLAEKHGRLELRVECNSYELPGLVNQLWNCRNAECRNWENRCVCECCLIRFTRSKGCDLSLVPLLREIKARAQGQHSQFSISNPRNGNRPAHYLAKMGKRSRPKVENKEGRTDPGNEEPAEIKPGGFPQELTEILWEDAFGRVNYNVEGGY